MVVVRLVSGCFAPPAAAAVMEVSLCTYRRRQRVFYLPIQHVCDAARDEARAQHRSHATPAAASPAAAAQMLV